MWEKMEKPWGLGVALFGFSFVIILIISTILALVKSDINLYPLQVLLPPFLLGWGHAVKTGRVWDKKTKVKGIQYFLAMELVVGILLFGMSPGFAEIVAKNLYLVFTLSVIVATAIMAVGVYIGLGMGEKLYVKSQEKRK